MSATTAPAEDAVNRLRRPPRIVILGAVRRRGVITLAAAAVLCAGCGQSHGSVSSTQPQQTSTRADAPSYHVHPQAVQPIAGSAARITAPPSDVTAGVSVEPVSQVKSLPQPMTVADIRQQLAQSGMTANSQQATLTPGGLAVAPIGAPAAVQEVIAAGNEIARLPYRYGGGHMTYEDTAYDCSGSISYVFAAAHLLDRTVVSGDLENWGKAGPGKWITVFANGDHVFMYVAGLRFDTVALAETGSRWSDRKADEPDIATFSVRHPAGL
jgi:cell wall-associated NlpC family hydrolase